MKMNQGVIWRCKYYLVSKYGSDMRTRWISKMLMWMLLICIMVHTRDTWLKFPGDNRPEKRSMKEMSVADMQFTSGRRPLDLLLTTGERNAPKTINNLADMDGKLASSYQSDSSRGIGEKEQSGHHSDSPTVKAGPHSITKLLFLGYCRGGSSISSEIFDIDERASFWYEPLDAFYFSKTGYYGRKDQKVLMYHNESDFRSSESWEHKDMAEFFKNIYDCKISKLPTELLAHRFMKHNSALDDYFRCYQRASPKSITDDLDICREKLQNVCGKSVDRSLQNKCNVVMGVLHSLPSGSDKQHIPMIERSLLNAGLDKSHINSNIKNMVSYRKCLDQLENIVGKCLDRAEQSCKGKQLRTTKVVRTTMPLIKSIIESVPDLLVTVFIRDPRAIAYSGAGRTKQESDIINNMKLICRKMRTDFIAKQQIDILKPGLVQVLKYEDFVQDPHYWAGQMYKHVGYSTPPRLDEFIQTHMFAGEDDGKKWGNIRPNATEVAYKWLQMVTPELRTRIQSMCPDVISLLGYPLY